MRRIAPIAERLARPWPALLLASLMASCRDSDRPPSAVPSRPLTANPGSPAPAAEQPGAVAATRALASKPDDLFVEVAMESGLRFVHQFCGSRIANILMSNGAGVAVLDFDRDGWMDLYLVNSGPLERVTEHAAGTRREPNRLYRNRGNGTFEDVTARARVEGTGYGSAAAVADYDADGWDDLYVVNVGTNLLYHNRGDGTFEEVGARAGVSNPGSGIGATWADLDRDGRLDLFVANYLTFDSASKLFFNPDAYPGPLSYRAESNVLYRNRGDGTFEDVSVESGIRLPEHRAMSVCAFDYELDGDSDFYLCNDSTPNTLLVNDGRGHFSEQAIPAGVAFNALGEPAGSMATSVGDCDGDLLPDLLVSRLGYGSFYVATPRHRFEDRMRSSGLGGLTAAQVGWGNNLFDFDNDGDLDLFLATGDANRLVGQPCLLLENNGRAEFSNARKRGGTFFSTPIRGRGSAQLDFNNDGMMDLVLTAIADRPFLLRNRGADGHWLLLDLRGTKSNPHGWGAHIRLTAEGRSRFVEARCPSGYLGQSDPRIHFGLGPSRKVDRIEIRWPAGGTQTLSGVAANQVLRITEP